MTDYGTIEMTLIERPEDFWALWDELEDDDSGFIHNRITLLDAFKKGEMYGLTVKETDSMYSRGADTDELFVKCKGTNSLYLLPCILLLDNEYMKEGNAQISIIWVHTRARRRGFAKKMVNSLSECYENIILSHPLPESIPFWKACGLL